MTGRVHERRDGQRREPGAQHPVGQFLGTGDVVARRERVAPTHGGVEDVVVAPQHALGHPRGAPGVDAVVVARRPGGEVPSFGGHRQRLLVPHTGAGADRRPAVGHLEDGAAIGEGAQRPGDGRCEPAMEDEPHEAGVGVEVLELPGDVAVVDVDGDGTDLETGQHRLDVLGAVGQLHPDAVAGPDPRRLQVVGEAVGPSVELAVGEPALAGDHGQGVGHHVGDQLEEVRQVQLHRRPSPRSAKGLPALTSRNARPSIPGSGPGHTVGRPRTWGRSAMGEAAPDIGPDDTPDASAVPDEDAAGGSRPGVGGPGAGGPS